MINKLVEKIKKTKAPIVVGLDPMLSYIPQHVQEKAFAEYGETLEGAAEAIWQFNKEIVDKTYDLIPAVKPQIAMYEQFGVPGIAASDEKDSVTAKAGDTVKYAIYMTDTKEEVIGAAMSFFYNDEYLKLNADSINCESFKTAIGNPKLKNYYTFTWTDVQNPVKLNGDKALVSAEFKVLKGGKTDLSYFISDMYGDDMTYLKSYKITCKLWVNGKEVEDSAVPIVIMIRQIPKNSGRFCKLH